MSHSLTRRRFLVGSASTALAAGAAGALTACGSDSSASGDAGSIEYWHINSQTGGGPALTSVVDKFNAQRNGVTVRTRFNSGYTDLIQNMQAAMAGGSRPDIAQIGYNYINYVAENLPFVSATDLAKRFGSQGVLDGIRENLLTLGQAKGTQLGTPYSLSVPVVFYNADMLRQAGLDPVKPPQQWTEWMDAAQQIKARTGKATISLLQFPGDNWILQALLESNGARVLGCANGHSVATFDTENGAQALDMLAKGIDARIVANLQAAQAQQAFLSGQTAALVASIASSANIRQQATFSVAAAPFPRSGTAQRRLPAGGNLLVVFSDDPAKQRAAWRFVEYLQQPDTLETWTTGTGYLAPRAAGSNATQPDPIETVADGELPDVVPWVSFPGSRGLQGAQVMYDATQSILNRQTSALDGLKQAAGKLNGLLAGTPCL